MLDDIKLTHRAIPLRVFLDGKPVHITNLEEIMMGAVIEIQFELLHYPISAARKHSFNAIIQQIQILQRGENRPPTAFKRKSIDEGPIQVDEDLTSSEENDTEQPLAKHRKGKVGLYTTTFD